MTSVRGPIGYGALLFHVASSMSGLRVPSSASSPRIVNVRSPVRSAPVAVKIIVGCAALSKKSPLVRWPSRASCAVSTLAVATTTRTAAERAGGFVEREAAARVAKRAERLRIADVLDQESDREMLGVELVARGLGRCRVRGAQQ